MVVAGRRKQFVLIVKNHLIFLCFKKIKYVKKEAKKQYQTGFYTPLFCGATQKEERAQTTCTPEGAAKGDYHFPINAV